MPYNLRGKTVFATGAGRGLCKAIVARYLAEGCNVLAFDNHAGNLEATVAQWRAAGFGDDRVLAHVGDVRVRGDIQAAIDAAVAAWGRIDVLANVAGIAGIRFMAENSRSLALEIVIMASSCVPATHMETSGAALTASDLLPLLRDGTVHGLAEVMNFRVPVRSLHAEGASERAPSIGLDHGRQLAVEELVLDPGQPRRRNLVNFPMTWRHLLTGDCPFVSPLNCRGKINFAQGCE